MAIVKVLETADINAMLGALFRLVEMDNHRASEIFWERHGDKG